MLWSYLDTTFSGDTITETWRVCPGDDETSCDIGPAHIMQDLFERIGQTASKTNPAPAATLPGIGSPYIGRPCDGDIPALFLRAPSIGEREQVQGKGCCREVTLTWSSLPNGTASEPPSSDANDPDDWCPKISANSVATLRAAQMLEFGGIYRLDRSNCDQTETEKQAISNYCLNLQIGDHARPQTSAGQPFDPPPELEDADWVYSLQFFRACNPDSPFDASVFEPFAGAINCSDFTLDISCRCYQHTFRARTARIQSVRVDGQEQRRQNPFTGRQETLRYMAVSFDIIERSSGWDFDLLNAGTRKCVRPDEGQPSACGQEVMTDANGYTLDHLTLLDKEGQPVCDEEWYTKWKRCKCVEFDSMPVLREYGE